MHRRLRRSAAAFTSVVLVLGLWSFAVEPRLLDVVHEQATVPNLPAAWAGRRVGLMSDVQIGMWLNNPGTSRRAVERLVAERPDLVLVAGDLVYGAGDSAGKVGAAVDILTPLVRAGIPTYAVLGNHDVASGSAPALTPALEAAGIPVLRNDSVALPDPGTGVPAGADPLHLVGLAPRVDGRDDDPMAGFADLAPDDPRIVLMHNPATFLALPGRSAPFAVAGHTHGGQLRMPLYAEWSASDVLDPIAVDEAGWSGPHTYEGNRIYVNRGIGMSLLPVRLNCPPEITIFTLEPA